MEEIIKRQLLARKTSIAHAYNANLFGYAHAGFEYERDQKILADAYLADHDYELATDDWWLKVNRFRCEDCKMVLYRENTTGIFFLGLEHRFEIPLPHIKTRGDVRRLCESLGIPLERE